MTATFGMFVKFPEPGRVKTRLAAAIGAELAAEMYSAFLSDLIPRFRDIAARRILAYAPDDQRSREFFERLSGGSFELWAQPEGSLGDRMRSFFEAFGPEPVVLVGSDSPTLLRGDVELALSALHRVDCVLGPATDGGVYLIGLNRKVADKHELPVPSVSAGLVPAERHLTATLHDDVEPLPTRLVRVDECLKTSIHPDKPGGERASTASGDVAVRCASTGASPVESLKRRQSVCVTKFESLFDRIEWSSLRVLEQMIDAVQEASASVELLPLCYDIDTVEDVDLLRGHLAALEITQPELWQELVQTRRALDVITQGRHYTPRP